MAALIIMLLFILLCLLQEILLCYKQLLLTNDQYLLICSLQVKHRAKIQLFPNSQPLHTFPARTYMAGIFHVPIFKWDLVENNIMHAWHFILSPTLGSLGLGDLNPSQSAPRIAVTSSIEVIGLWPFTSAP